MLAILDWIYGPAGQTDQYYLLMRDIIMVMPWWYPLFWIGVGGFVICFRFHRRWRRNSLARKAAGRVQTRTGRIMSRHAAERAALRLLRRPANDFKAINHISAA